MKFNPHDVVVGRSLELYGEFSELEHMLLRQLVNRGDVVIDAGANVGCHALMFSKRAGETGVVHAFEPQPAMFELLKSNISQNIAGNVRAHAAALGEENGTLVIPEIDYTLTENFSGLALGNWSCGSEVEVKTIDGLQLERCDLIKADVEGMELQVLKGAAQTIKRLRPIIYVENNEKTSKCELACYIAELGYDMYWHLPLLFNPNNFFGNQDNVFSDLCSANMLCIHSEVAIGNFGLRRVKISAC